jgi:predicted metal-dependent phosphoesterase TrpH
MRRVAFHVHSRSSYDSLSSPKSIVRFCRNHGIQSACITDHDTIRGSIEAAKIAEDYGIQAIIGAEYYTEIGDVIGIFLQEEIGSRKSLDVIKKIKEQGGIAVLPHPFHGHRLTDELLHAIDVIEVFNARCSESENFQAFDLAKQLRKPMVAGSDAHFVSDIIGCTMSFDIDRIIVPDDFVSTSRTWKAVSTHPLRTRTSQITKAVKTLDPLLLWRSSRSFVYTMLHDAHFASHIERKVYHNEWNREQNG